LTLVQNDVYYVTIMKTHYPYPSIEQFRHVIRNVQRQAQYVGNDEDCDPIYDHLKPLPVLDYQGTVKLHGTNFGVIRDKTTGETWFQSREQIITPERDNAGAARFFSDKNLDSIFDKIPGNIVAIFAEWVGFGVQSKVAVSQISKRAVIFDIKIIDEDRWLSAEEVSKISDPDNAIYNVYDYGVFNVQIDFNKPEEINNQLVKITTEIADCCPVGKAFGVNDLGEGAVWRCITPGYESSKFWMKIKDERHAGSKVTALKEVDSEKITRLKEIAEKITPAWRLDQMLEKCCNLNNGGFIDLKQIGEFFKLVNQDICKEDMDILTDAGIEFKDVVKYVTQISKNYYLTKEKEIK